MQISYSQPRVKYLILKSLRTLRLEVRLSSSRLRRSVHFYEGHAPRPRTVRRIRTRPESWGTTQRRANCSVTRTTRAGTADAGHECRRSGNPRRDAEEALAQ